MRVRSRVDRRRGPGVAGSLVAALALTAATAAEDAPRTSRVTAGPQYGGSALHRLMLGASYRELWTTPVEVEELDLAAEGGGLTPTARVGGQQTKGLALLGGDGRSYTFRSLDKDPSNILPEELQDTFVEDLVQDQMASQHPAGALVADEIARAVGVATVPIRLVVLPDDPALGEFRKDFAGVVGTFAEYPTASDARHPGFAGAIEIVDHLALFARLADSPDDRVAVREFLRARLLDLLVSDFDRHRKQWRWAKGAGDPFWHPIPEDRDQAFARYEGLLVRAAAGYVPQLRTFRPKYDRIMGLTYNGRDQDRWLLPELSRDVWRELAHSMKGQVTDAVIERAARRMPREWYAIDGARLAAALKRRRDTLPEAADRFYRHLARQVDVQGTNAPEVARVRRLERGAVAVEVARRAEDGTGGEPYFSRRFVPGETAEVRLYLRGGDDRVVVEGPAGPIRLRVLGGPGDDVLDDAKAGGTRLYDAAGRDEVVAGPGTAWDRRPHEPKVSKTSPWIPPRDWGRDWFPLPWTSFSSDAGVFLGGGFAARSYGFRQHPHASQHSLKAGWAFGANQPRIDYSGDFHRASSRVTAGLTAHLSGLDVLRFYGLGNETAPEEDGARNKVRQQQVAFAPTLTLPVAGALECTIAPSLRYARTEEGDRLIDAVKPYGYGDFGQVGGWARLRLDTRRALGRASRSSLQLPLNDEAGAYPVRGVLVEATGAVFPKAWDVETTYGWLAGDASTYLTAGPRGRATLALRAGGKRMLGDRYPFHDAAAVGGGGLFSGQDAVRGLRPNRYLGDGALYANADLRLYLSRFFVALPGEWGVFGFADAGRVWLAGESSDTWHTSWGGGLWVGLLSRSNAVAFTVAKTDDRTAFNVRAGFAF